MHSREEQEYNGKRKKQHTDDIDPQVSVLDVDESKTLIIFKTQSEHKLSNIIEQQPMKTTGLFIDPRQHEQFKIGTSRF